MHRLINLSIKAGKICAVILLWLFLFTVKASAQSLGDPIVNITFGSGTAAHAGALSADSGYTSYTYSSADFPFDGSYTIERTTNTPNIWWTTSDHTGNANGYMMVVNASVSKTDYFYKRQVTGLCGATAYQFSAWVGNLLKGTDKSPPDITFSILNLDGTVIQSYDTGQIPLTTTAFKWVQETFNFTLPSGVTSVIIQMTNNANGGAPANDLALDDITFRPYGAQVSAVFDNSTATSEATCAGISKTVTINSTTTLAQGYSQKVQMLINNVWTDQSAASTASSFTISSPMIAGTYYYRLVTALTENVSSAQCVVGSNQLSLVVTPAPTAAFTGTALTCLGTGTTFIDQSTASGGTISVWAWDFGDGQQSSLQNPTHTYAKTGNYIVNLTVSNSNGCTSAAPPVTVHVSALPVASFSYSSPDCATSAVTITDKSTSGEGLIATWAWDYGDGNSDTKTDNAVFQHIYTTAGTYTIKLVVTNINGCATNASQTITVSPLPITDFITPDVCLADSYALFTDNTTISDNSNSKFTYLWNFGDPNSTAVNNVSTLQNPQHKYSKAAVYEVSLTVTTNNGCTVSKTKSFTVNGSIPVAGFNVLNSTTLCSNREVLFVNQATVDFGSITKIQMFYDYGNNSAVIETDNDPTPGKLYRHTYPQFHTPATTTYQVRMLAYSGGTCVSEADKTITLLATPTLTFMVPSAICLNGGTIQFAAAENSGIAGSGVYSGTGVSSTGVFNPLISGVGTFTMTYIYTATNACADTLTGSIIVNPIPTVSAGPALTVLEGGNTTIAATASGDSLTYLWSPTTGLSSPKVLNPVVTPTKDQTYILTVTNSEGCSISSSVKVTVLKSPVVPNTFTPNSDGVNDTWDIQYLSTYPDCTVQVFNRYGLRLFYSIGYGTPWNGTYNGAALPPAVYYYVIDPKHGRSLVSGWVAILK